jgi:hypothetical protein
MTDVELKKRVSMSCGTFYVFEETIGIPDPKTKIIIKRRSAIGLMSVVEVLNGLDIESLEANLTTLSIKSATGAVQSIAICGKQDIS